MHCGQLPAPPPPLSPEEDRGRPGRDGPGPEAAAAAARGSGPPSAALSRPRPRPGPAPGDAPPRAAASAAAASAAAAGTEQVRRAGRAGWGAGGPSADSRARPGSPPGAASQRPPLPSRRVSARGAGTLAYTAWAASQAWTRSLPGHPPPSPAGRPACLPAGVCPSLRPSAPAPWLHLPSPCPVAPSCLHTLSPCPAPALLPPALLPAPPLQLRPETPRRVLWLLHLPSRPLTCLSLGSPLLWPRPSRFLSCPSIPSRTPSHLFPLARAGLRCLFLPGLPESHTRLAHTLPSYTSTPTFTCHELPTT